MTEMFWSQSVLLIQAKDYVQTEQTEILDIFAILVLGIEVSDLVLQLN